MSTEAATTTPDYAMNRAVLRDLTVDDLRDARLLYEWVVNHTKAEVKPFVRIATETDVVDISFEEYRAIFGLLAEGRWGAKNGRSDHA